MAAKWVCGAECQITATGATLAPDRKHITTISGGTITNESGGRNGGRRWQVAATGVQATFRPYGPASESVLHTRFYVRFEGSLPTADCQVFIAPAAAGSWPGLYYRSSDTKLYAAMSSTPNTTTGVTVVANTWYLIELKGDISVTPRTCDVRVNGTACSQATVSTATSTFATTSIRFGVNCDNTTANATISFDDIFVEWGSTAAYPLGAGRVDAVSPASDGTHSFTPAGDFIYNGGGSVDPTATDTWQRVDDPPNSTTDYIGIASALAGEYVEWNVGTLPGPAITINGVEVIGAFHAAGTASCKASLRMVEGGSNVDIITDNDVSNTSVGNYSSHQATKPSGGAWTQSTLQAVKFRFTSSWTTEDVNPDPYCDAVMMEVDWIETTPNILLSGTIAGLSELTGSIDAYKFANVEITGMQQGTYSSNTDPWTLTYPTNINSGDLLVAYLSVDGHIAGSNWPEGWRISVWETWSGSNTGLLNLKIADGTETGTFQVTLGASEQGNWICFRVTNWYSDGATSSSDLDGRVKVGTSLNSVGGNADPSNVDVTINWGTDNTLWIALCSIDDNSTITSSPISPTTFTTIANKDSTGTASAALGSAYVKMRQASLNPGPFTNTSFPWSTNTIAIRPATILLTCNGLSTLSAMLNVSHNLTGTIGGISTVDAAVKMSYVLIGTITGNVITSGVLTGAHSLEGTCVGLAVLSAQLAIQEPSTEAAHGISSQTADQQLTAGAGWNVVSGCSISSSVFTAGQVYLLLAMADQQGSNANGQVGFRVVHGSTAFEDSEESWETVSATQTTRRHRYFWWNLWTAVGGEGLTVEHNTGGDTVYTDQIQLAYINLNDLASSDRQFTERSNDDTLGTSYTDGASVTFTANGTDIWLLLNSAYLYPGSATTACKSRGNLDTGTSVWGEAINEGEDATNDRFVMCFARGIVPSNGSHTFKEESATTSGTSHTRLHSKAAAINLTKYFRDVSQVFTAAAVDYTASAWADLVQTLSHTKSVNGDVLIIASNIQRPAANGWDIHQRLRVDGVDTPTTQTSDNYTGSVRVADALTDYTGWTGFTIVNATATLDIDVDGYVDATSAGRGYLDRAIVAFSMSLKSQGQLDGSISGSCELSGNLNRVRELSGNIAPTSGLDGNLTVVVELKGTVVGTSALSGDLTVVKGGINLEGTITSISAVDAKLTVSRPLSGTVAGTSVISSGSLTTSKLLVGTITGTSDVGGNYLTVHHPLQSIIVGTSVLRDTDYLTVTHSLNGSIINVGVLSSTLSSSTSLQGLVVGTSDLVTGVGVNKKLLGNVVGTSIFTGNLTVSHSLASLIDGNSTLSATILLLKSLECIVIGTTNLVGNVNVDILLVGSVPATSNLSGNLSITKVLQSVCTAVSVVSDASLTVTKKLEGTIIGAVDLSGDLTVIKAGVNLEGAVVCVSTVSATLTVPHPLSGVITGTSTVSDALLTVAKSLTGTVVGIAVVSNASLTIAKSLTSTIDVTGILTGSLTVSRTVSGLITAASVVDDTEYLTVNHSLTGLINGNGVLSTNLSVTKPLAGNIVGTSDLVGYLTVSRPLNGLVTATSSLDDTDYLTVAHSLEGFIVSITTQTGGADKYVEQRGSITGVSDVSGTLTVTPSTPQTRPYYYNYLTRPYGVM